ncbi:ubiquitin-specific protease [Saccharomycopsis crataegensis]|uniref:Ubiquitin carboxyl-terminal hydrolase n=1 Tax=Saccharomycopsis crataegensis TaxID=43959 RepID=A0AAV5QSB2_9ASCO|nr:ubiquitin-specific protease [Saccharomycopsis crataegensis]
MLSFIESLLDYIKIDLAKHYSSSFTPDNFQFFLVIGASLFFLYTPTKFLLYAVQKPTKRKDRRNYSRYLTRFANTIFNALDYLKENYLMSMYSKRTKSFQKSNLRILGKHAMKHGGNVGGLINDGNTCFMNCVIQSLASSNDFVEYLDERVRCISDNYTETSQNDTPTANEESNDSDNNTDEKSSASGSLFNRLGLSSSSNSLSEEKKKHFIYSLSMMLTKLNSKHGNTNSDYNLAPLAKKMSNGFEKHSFLGYNQEDAQEFFQLVLSNIEKDSKTITPETSDNKEKTVSLTRDDLDKLNSNVDGLSNFYIPAIQIDPSLENVDQTAFKYKFLTPADGLTVERIGCLKCGETGGLRYSVSSGLSLSLPENSSYKSIELDSLLSNYISEEIIEGVECDRCSLEYVVEFLTKELESENTPEFLKTKYLERIDAIKKELAKPIISDEVAKINKSKNIREKGKKSKQAYISKPSAYLSLHINRSVFDYSTGYIRKNNCSIDFPTKLDLNKYVASYDDVNLDARLSMRKQDDLIKAKYEAMGHKLVGEDLDDVHSPSATESLKSSESEIFEETTGIADSVSDIEDIKVDDEAKQMKQGSNNSNPSSSSKIEELEQQISSFYKPELVYNLKAVIVHYGTHNYGHYIAFRKYRGTWWRISDETVEVVDEQQVLSTPGVFMLFYEKPNEKDSQYEFDLESLDNDDPESHLDVEIDPQALQRVKLDGPSDTSSCESDSDSDNDSDNDSESDDEITEAEKLEAEKEQSMAIATIGI